MIMRKTILLQILTILLFGFTSFMVKANNNCSEEKGSPIIHKARIYTEKFYKKEFDFVYSNFSKEMKNAMSLDALKDFHTQVLNQLGSESSVLNEKLDSITSPFYIYDRVVSYGKYKGPVLVRWVLNDKMIVQGFMITPIPKEASSKYLTYNTKTDLILPFTDEWFVYWGGRTITDNYHSAYSDQRFAYDFLQVKEKKTFANNGDKNEDYYCFAKKVLAPGKGKVVSVENNILDNVPGEMNPKNTLGNYIVIDHLNGEFSFLAHFKQGSIKLKVGDTVTQGQVIGLCGNSGNSSEPHIHYHIQNTSVFGKGEGLPAIFKSYKESNRVVEVGEPTRGQLVRNIE